MAGFIDPGTVGRPGEVHDSALNPVGMEAETTDRKVYVYLKGVASTADKSWVTYDEDGITALIASGTAATCRGPVAVSTAAVVADKYGWYARRGEHEALAISGGSAADNAIVYATATAGRVDDVAVANNQIIGAIFRSAEGATTAGVATVQLNFPWIGVDEAAA